MIFYHNHYYDLHHVIVSNSHIKQQLCCFCCYGYGLCSSKQVAKLANLSTTTKMAFYPCYSKRHGLIKFIEISSYGLVKIGKGLYNPSFLLCTNLVFWHHTNVYVMFYILYHIKLVNVFILSHFCDFVITLFHHWHVMYFLLTLMCNLPLGT
jgi:hypothetical protein